MTKLNQLKQHIETGGWQPIAEAPRDATNILVLDLNGLVHLAYYTNHTHTFNTAYPEKILDMRLTHFKDLDADMKMLEMAMEVVEKQRREHDSLLSFIEGMGRNISAFVKTIPVA